MYVRVVSVLFSNYISMQFKILNNKSRIQIKKFLLELVSKPQEIMLEVEFI